MKIKQIKPYVILITLFFYCLGFILLFTQHDTDGMILVIVTHAYYSTHRIELIENALKEHKDKPD
jgi:hypothetical protein